MWPALKAALTNSPTPQEKQTPSARAQRLARNGPIKTTYPSNPVPLPPTFLHPSTLPADARPITATPIHWPSTTIPEYDGCYALVLDHVLSPSECADLIAYAEASVPADAPLRNSAEDAWGPALVNVGGGFEVLDSGYRNGDRIVWDCEEVVGRIWERCKGVEGVWERMGVVGGGEEVITGLRPRRRKEGEWRFVGVNERMRFLRYGVGGFFRPHCDSSYADTSDPERIRRTLFTIHLYLNDAKAENSEAELVGGATSFFSSNEKRKIDVDPKAGRVLIFQHKRLLHSGDDVLAGTKYTMRTDIMYEYIQDEAMEVDES